MPASRSTLLRLVRQAPSPPPADPRVLGVDDWAWRRGQRYGSILVDLERRRPIKLLPDRTAESLAAWLREHPGIDVISRDRAGAYADGARQGAPDAVQVADRFHLLANVGELLERVLGSRRTALREAAAAVDRTLAQDQQPVMDNAATSGPPPGKRRAQQGREERRAQRLARYDAVVALHQEGHSHAAISRQTGLGRKTVRRYLRAGAFPERAAAPARPTMLAPYEAYLRARWTEGCHNAQQLWREIRSQGYAGQAANVRRYLARWRPEPGRPGPTVRQDQADDAPPTPPVATADAGAITTPGALAAAPCGETLTSDERAYRDLEGQQLLGEQDLAAKDPADVPDALLHRPVRRQMRPHVRQHQLLHPGRLGHLGGARRAALPAADVRSASASVSPPGSSR